MAAGRLRHRLPKAERAVTNGDFGSDLERTAFRLEFAPALRALAHGDLEANESYLPSGVASEPTGRRHSTIRTPTGAPKDRASPSARTRPPTPPQSVDHCQRKIRRIPAQKCRQRLLEVAHCSL